MAAAKKPTKEAEDVPLWMRDDEPTEEEAKKLQQANVRRSSLQVDSKMGYNNNSFTHSGGRNTRSSTVSKSPTLATISDDKSASRYVHFKCHTIICTSISKNYFIRVTNCKLFVLAGPNFFCCN